MERAIDRLAKWLVEEQDARSTELRSRRHLLRRGMSIATGMVGGIVLGARARSADA
jgi:hypothetical protein